MKTFIIDELNKIEIVCQSLKTRNGFKHVATLIDHGIEREEVKINYLNRTWEAYEYDDVIHKLIDKVWKEETAKKYKEVVRAINEKAPNPFAALASVITMIEVFPGDQKTKNDWKARMLKAGLGNQGLIMPDDWDQLSEDEKEARLNAVIKQLA